MSHEEVMKIARKRGFLWSSFEIYSGVAGFVDYGPLGALLKNKIMNKWREYYIIKEGFYEMESPTVMPEEVFKASGHVDHFNDPMTQCKECKEVYRADHIIEEITGRDVEGLENQKLTEIISEEKIRCPRCGGHLTHVWSYNLMFQTLIGAKGKKIGYLRPETAQGIFTPFKRLLRFFRNKLPFGVVQLGKAYRNEISPRQGVIRLREFTQAEAEIFVNPKEKTHPRFHTIKTEKLRLHPAENQEKNKKPITITAGEAVEKGIISSELLTYHLWLAKKFLVDIGIPEEVIRFRQHLPTEMAHYAIDCWDVEIKTNRYGWIEIIGIADRTDYDLKSHSEHSKEDLKVFIEYEKPKIIKKETIQAKMDKIGPKFKKDAAKIIKALEGLDPKIVKKELKENGQFKLELDKTYTLIEEDLEFKEVEKTIKGERIFPHVIEPSFGIDRIIYSLLLHSYKKEEGRTYFNFPVDIAPVEVAVLPLINKEKLVQLALNIKEDLRNNGFIAEFDASGTIGRRYARIDEIGVPFAVTVDHQSLKDHNVTLRDRNTTKQVRIPIKELTKILEDLLKRRKKFQDLSHSYKIQN
ncbi:glycine--tRNA ligase [Methanothermobacter tenebrarum]|uniref:Glycine--tRNA ligase n=1 Tax=Methanothermobacter tenebrarum TaxID=680118 RepID=A0A328PE98_9EURY|nr:glycine--tRNA ligase [Methanothermobacter tenebrarum]MBC7101114.1 glycine--tRNA ligase [Methanobacteriales archaeon]MBC7118513.1 glycine--tRNA ligase [Methanobacteriaceae archaeon]NPV64110.1 glycine--tRNA ligase [Methanobacteriaceae archaeon]RAO79733.1 glycine--tRNA ligase [Methanothermobacter tenebrarum]